MKASGRGVKPFVVGRSSNLGPDGPQFAGRCSLRIQMPLRDDKFKLTTLPQGTLSS